MALLAAAGLFPAPGVAQGRISLPITFKPPQPQINSIPGCSITVGFARSPGTTSPGRARPLFRVVYPRGHPQCSFMIADPHVETFDRIRYDFQAAGEFVGIESLDDDLEVQYRLEAGGRPDVSYISAVAARVAGHRLSFSSDPETPLRIDGEPVDLPDAHMVELAEAVDAALVRYGERYTVIWPDGSNLHVDVRPRHLNAYFLASKARDGRLAGLFGDGDGDPDNDFQTRGGRLLPAPPDFEPLYEVFGESWRVRPEESLFHYEPGESVESFTDRAVPSAPATAERLGPAERARAEAVCREAGVIDPELLGECIVDYGYTGDEAFVASAAAEQPPPEFAGPPWSGPEPIVSGACRLDRMANPIASFRGDAGHTGRFGPSSSVPSGEELWSAGSFRRGHDPLAVGGRVIAARDPAGLVALDGRTGRQLWEAGEARGRIAGRGLLAAGGAVFVAWSEELAAFDLESGAECWRLPVGRASGATMADGRLFVSVFAEPNGYVAAVDPASGRIRWRHDITASHLAARPSVPAVGGGAVYVGDGQDFLALDAETGDVVWRAAGVGTVDETVAYGQGTVYVPGSVLEAIDASSGRARWRWEPEPGGGKPTGSPALSDDLVHVADARHLHAIERSSGTEAWRIEADRGDRFNSPVLAGEVLYSVLRSGVLLAVDARTGAELRRVEIPDRERRTGDTVPIPADGRLYFVFWGRLHAYR